MRAPDITWRGEDISRLVLGTAQLGQPYGIVNKVGEPGPKQATEIIETCRNLGVRFADTAQDYGESEAQLGRVMARAGPMHVTSKVSAALLDRPDRVCESVRQSWRRLGARRIWGMLLYAEDELPPWNGAATELCACRDHGLVHRIGVSTSSVRAAFEALNHPEVGFIQVPCNAWNQEMLQRGVLKYAGLRDKPCFVRGVYLQGLLAVSEAEAAARVPAAKRALKRWHELVHELGFRTSKEAAVRFAVSLGAPLVVGAEAAEQIRETEALMHKGAVSGEVVEAIRRRMSPFLSRHILCPWLW